MTTTDAAPDRAERLAYLARTDAELKLYIDPAHMSYLPVYLGRADVRHALGEPAEAVLRELAHAARVYADSGGIFLTKWPHNLFRKRRLEPLEVFLASADEEALTGIREHFTVDPFSLWAGLEPDSLDAELRVVTPHFAGGGCESPVQAAGALAVFYWLSLSAAIREDISAFELVRQRAGSFNDDFGHLLGGAAAGAIARLRTLHEALQVIRTERPPNAAEVVARAVHRHVQLSAAEYRRMADKDPTAHALGQGGLDRTALCLLALARAFQIDAGQALRAAGAAQQWLDYAVALGHTLPREDHPT